MFIRLRLLSDHKLSFAFFMKPWAKSIFETICYSKTLKKKLVFVLSDLKVTSAQA